jgi:hypothetical protein
MTLEYTCQVSELVELKRNPTHNYLNELSEIYFK